MLLESCSQYKTARLFLLALEMRYVCLYWWEEIINGRRQEQKYLRKGMVVPKVMLTLAVHLGNSQVEMPIYSLTGAVFSVVNERSSRSRGGALDIIWT